MLTNSFYESLVATYIENQNGQSLDAFNEVMYLKTIVCGLQLNVEINESEKASLTDIVIMISKLGVSFIPPYNNVTVRPSTTANGNREFTIGLSLTGACIVINSEPNLNIESLYAIGSNKQPLSNESKLFCDAVDPLDISGAICVINHCGDPLTSIITRHELDEIARLSGLDSLSIEFAKYHVLKRGIKCLLTPINSPLSMLQQITKLSDLKRFEKF